MLNVNNTGPVGYKTVKVAKLNSIIQIVFFTHQVCPPNFRSRSRRLSVCRWRRCTRLIMFTEKEKSQCVLWFLETKSLVNVLHKFRNEFRRKPPHVNIFRWSEQFKEPGGVCKKSHLENPELRKPGFNCS
jgi:hypothetical protein